MKTLSRLICIIMLLLPMTAGAQVVTQEQDSLRISLLTCAPGQEVYELYGHTAIRVLDNNDTKDDWAYNFGWFSFNQPNFAWRFVLGETYYTLAQQSFGLFMIDYANHERSVSEQVLNLTPAEARRVKADLQQLLTQQGFEELTYKNHFDPFEPYKIRIAHWQYHYSFLYDNCTSRAVSTIVRAIEAEGGKVIWQTTPERLYHRLSTCLSTPENPNAWLSKKGAEGLKSLSPRDMVHQHTGTSPWYEFGQDLMLDTETDEAHELDSDVIRNFLPLYAYAYLADATIVNADGTTRPMVVSDTPIYQAPAAPQSDPSPLTPTVVAIVLLILATWLTWQALRHKTCSKAAHIFDYTMMTLRGAVGIVLFILAFCSAHPAVHNNWLLLIFNPLVLIGIPVKYYLDARTRILYNVLPAVLSVILIIVGLLGLQNLPVAIYILACILLVRGIPAAYKAIFN